MAEREIRLMTFRVAGDSFVLDIMAIRQIIAYGGCTPVPQAPSFVEGIIVLRNEVIPVIELRSRLRPQSAADTRSPLVLILGSSAGTVGFKVDEVRRIITVEPDSILPAPPLIRGMRGELFIGVVPDGEDLHLLLDAETILTRDEVEELRNVEWEVST